VIRGWNRGIADTIASEAIHTSGWCLKLSGANLESLIAGAERKGEEPLVEDVKFLLSLYK